MNKTRYTITVERSEVIETVTRREWVKGGPDGRLAQDEYGYTPQVPLITTETVKVLDIKLSKLNVAALIAAIMSAGTV